MITMLLCSLFTLFVIAWVLYVNASDRKIFEQELVGDLADDSEAHR